MESWPFQPQTRPAAPAGPAADPGSVQARLGQARRHGAAAEASSGATCEGYSAGGVASAAEGVAPWIWGVALGHFSVCWWGFYEFLEEGGGFSSISAGSVWVSAIGLFHGVDGVDAADSLQDLHHNVQDVRPL